LNGTLPRLTVADLGTKAPEEEAALELLERGATVAAPEQALSASASNAAMKTTNLFAGKQMSVVI
jgi:hypothetical protein